MHVVVLIHGISGHASDLAQLADQMATWPDLLVLAPTCNEGRTGDGIVTLAERIRDCLLDQVPGPAPVDLSIVGHSLGGLVGRYLAMLLHEDPTCRARWRPVCFVTIATPHLGSRQQTRGVLPLQVTSIVSNTLLSRTINELLLHDPGLLLRRMAIERPFLEALEWFPQLILYANVRHDLAVHYSTSAIRRRNPWHTVVDARVAIVPDQVGCRIPSSVELIEEMVSHLDELPWTRLAVFPERPWSAHIDIVGMGTGSDFVMKDLAGRMYAAFESIKPLESS